MYCIAISNYIVKYICIIEHCCVNVCVCVHLCALLSSSVSTQLNHKFLSLSLYIDTIFFCVAQAVYRLVCRSTTNPKVKLKNHPPEIRYDIFLNDKIINSTVYSRVVAFSKTPVSQCTSKFNSDNTHIILRNC